MVRPTKTEKHIVDGLNALPGLRLRLMNGVTPNKVSFLFAKAEEQELVAMREKMGTCDEPAMKVVLLMKAATDGYTYHHLASFAYLYFL